MKESDMPRVIVKLWKGKSEAQVRQSSKPGKVSAEPIFLAVWNAWLPFPQRIEISASEIQPAEMMQVEQFFR
jgi:hypothetical protein